MDNEFDFHFPPVHVESHPVTGACFLRSKWSSQKVKPENDGQVASLGISRNFPIPFLHSEVAEILGIEDVTFMLRRAARGILGV